MRPYPLSATDVSLSVRATLIEHLPARLADSPRPLPEPTSYEQTPTPEAIRRIAGSTLAVIVPGLRGEPERFAEGHELTWVVNVAVWHQQTGQMSLLTAGGDYAAAVRRTLLDHCPAVASDVDHVTESWDLMGDGLTEQTLGMSIVEFAMRTPDSLLYATSPDTSGPVVETVHITHNP